MGAQHAGPTQQHQQRKPTRRPSRRSVRIHRSYTVDEAARVTGYAKGTIRRWINSGDLAAITDQRPNLILGGDLGDFLKARAASRPKLRLEECYCLKCRAPRLPAFGMVDYVPLTSTKGNLGAFCSSCETVMHKVVPVAALAKLAGILDRTPQQACEHLEDTANLSLNDHLATEPKTHA